MDHFIWEQAKAIVMMCIAKSYHSWSIASHKQVSAAGVGIGVEGGAEVNIRRKTVSLLKLFCMC